MVRVKARVRFRVGIKSYGKLPGLEFRFELGLELRVRIRVRIKGSILNTKK